MIQKNANLAQFRSGQVPCSYFEMSASPSSSCSLFFCQLAILLLLLQWVCRVKIVRTPALPSLSWRVVPTRSFSRRRTKHHEGGVCWRWKAHGKAADYIDPSFFVTKNRCKGGFFFNIEFIKLYLHIHNRWILQLTESISVWITNSPESVRLIKCNPVSYILMLRIYKGKRV